MFSFKIIDGVFDVLKYRMQLQFVYFLNFKHRECKEFLKLSEWWKKLFEIENKS